MTVIEKSDLLKMRLMLPAAGYKLLKNRKNARLCRARKKEANQTVHQSYGELEQENQKMQRYIQKALDKLKKVDARFKAKKASSQNSKSFSSSKENASGESQDLSSSMTIDRGISSRFLPTESYSGSA
jgi:hypothetical protein